jgi:hypothetical protein
VLECNRTRAPAARHGSFGSCPWPAAEDCPGQWYGAGKKRICLPLGAASFADRAVWFTPGARPSEAPFDNPASALGEPDYRRTTSPDFISLGCDGTLVLEFTDNVLVDVDGMDLYVFEVGPYVEETELAISADGRVWRVVGRIEGSRADVDIASLAQPDERLRFVRLANVSKKGCGGRHSGADIDAVAAVGAQLRLSFDAAVLFDVGQAELEPQAQAELAAAAAANSSRPSPRRTATSSTTTRPPRRPPTCTWASTCRRRASPAASAGAPTPRGCRSRTRPR